MFWEYRQYCFRFDSVSFVVRKRASTYEERGDFVQDVDCFAGGALFGFGITCCWVCGGRHCEAFLCLRFVVAIVSQHERESCDTLMLFVSASGRRNRGGLRLSHDQDDPLQLLDVSLCLSLSDDHYSIIACRRANTPSPCTFVMIV